MRPDAYKYRLRRFLTFFHPSPKFHFSLYHCITVSERGKEKDKIVKIRELETPSTDTKQLIQLFRSCISAVSAPFHPPQKTRDTKQKAPDTTANPSLYRLLYHSKPLFINILNPLKPPLIHDTTIFRKLSPHTFLQKKKRAYRHTPLCIFHPHQCKYTPFDINFENTSIFCIFAKDITH